MAWFGGSDEDSGRQSGGGVLDFVWKAVKLIGIAAAAVLTLGAVFDWSPRAKIFIDELTGSTREGDKRGAATWALGMYEKLIKNPINNLLNPNATKDDFSGTIKSGDHSLHKVPTQLVTNPVATNRDNYLETENSTKKEKEWETLEESERFKKREEFRAKRGDTLKYGIAIVESNIAAEEFIAKNKDSGLPLPPVIPLTIPELPKELDEYRKSKGVSDESWKELARNPLKMVQRLEEMIAKDTSQRPDGLNTKSEGGLSGVGTMAGAVAGSARARLVARGLWYGTKLTGVGAVVGTAAEWAISPLFSDAFDNIEEIGSGGKYSSTNSITSLKQISTLKIDDYSSSSFMNAMDTRFGTRGVQSSSELYDMISQETIAKLIDANRFSEASIIVKEATEEFKRAQGKLMESYPDKGTRSRNENYKEKNNQYNNAINRYQEIEKFIKVEQARYEYEKEGGYGDKVYSAILTAASIAPNMAKDYAQKVAEFGSNGSAAPSPHTTPPPQTPEQQQTSATGTVPLENIKANTTAVKPPHLAELDAVLKAASGDNDIHPLFPNLAREKARKETLNGQMNHANPASVTEGFISVSQHGLPVRTPVGSDQKGGKVFGLE